MAQVKTFSLFSDFDISLFKAGKHYRLYEKLGSHLTFLDGVEGTYFAVWAPTANQVSVIGDFNHWKDGEHKLNVRWDSSGIWEGFIPMVEKGMTYKYKIHSNNQGYISEKADPYARRCEHPPKTASVVWEDNYQWKDKKWLKRNPDALSEAESLFNKIEWMIADITDVTSLEAAFKNIEYVFGIITI